ncbi:MAG: UDP-N-acetylmuramate--L-alanine ligase [Pseudomonadota bacterium]
MNLTGNVIPSRVKRIHMIAVCGTGMGALACMLKDLGYEVTGSDHDVYPPMSDFLDSKGIPIFKGFDAGNMDCDPDLVIIGNAVSRTNPEAVAVMDRQIPYCSMPQALNRFAASGKKIILITGTHGKTTTSSIMAHLLYEAGMDPSFMIGGILKGFDSNYRIGNGEYIVIEGDEYDTAFFDKGPKFMHYPPHIAVITSVEFDHADIYRDLDHVKSAFSRFAGSVPASSLIVACQDDPNVREIMGAAVSRVAWYGQMAGGWSIRDLGIENKNTRVTLVRPDGSQIPVSTPLMGCHNLMNLLAVTAAGHDLGIPESTMVKAFSTFSGVRRRQEVRGIRHQITVMDDFAHHPTAVRETIRAVKPFYSEGRLIAVFEPRTNSSMRAVFQDQYPLCFDEADLICIRRPSRLDKIPENQRLSSEKLVSDIQARGKAALLFDTTDALMEHLVKVATKNDLLLIMSNGGFDNIHHRLLEVL